MVAAGGVVVAEVVVAEVVVAVVVVAVVVVSVLVLVAAAAAVEMVYSRHTRCAMK